MVLLQSVLLLAVLIQFMLRICKIATDAALAATVTIRHSLAYALRLAHYALLIIHQTS